MVFEPKSCEVTLWRLVTAAEAWVVMNIEHTSPRTITDALVRMVATPY
jgi:hypothetical protein